MRKAGSTLEAPPRRIMVAIAEERSARVALSRAAAWAERFGSELYVLHVTPSTPARAFLPAHDLGARREPRQRREVQGPQPDHAAQPHDHAAQSLVELCKQLLPASLGGTRMLSGRGPFAETCVRAARDLGAGLLVISDESASRAERVVHCAAEHRIPVVIARTHRARGTIVAASNLRRPNYPVLRAGLTFASSTAAPLTFVHNVAPIALVSGLRNAPVGVPVSSSLSSRRLVELQTVARTASRYVESLVLNQPSNAGAVLDAARDRDADLIVVGIGRAPWWRRLLGKTMVTTIMQHAEPSVLAVPV